MQINDRTLAIQRGSKNVSVQLPALAVDAVARVYAVPEDYREDGIFVALVVTGTSEEIPACDPAGVQHLGDIAYPAASDLQLSAAKAAKLQEVNAACDAAVFALTVTYPQAEIQSWPQQVKEADAFTADPQTPVPLLETIAVQRSLAVIDLVQRVHTKVTAYAQASGYLIGKRQVLEDAIDAAASMPELEAVAWMD